MVKDNKGLLFGVVLPTALAFRFPGLVIAALRVFAAAVPALWVQLLRMGVARDAAAVADYLWRRLIQQVRVCPLGIPVQSPPAPTSETTGRLPEHAAHHRWATLGDPEPPGPVSHFPRQMWWWAP